MSTKTGFDFIFEVIKENDRLGGLFLFTPVKTRKDKILQLTTLLASPIIILTFITSTMYITNFSLLSMILSFGLASVVLNIICAVTLVYWNKLEIQSLLNWCRKVYDLDEYSHPKLLTAAIIRMEECWKLTMKLLKGARIVLCGMAVMITLGFAIIGLFLPEKIHPKYSPPLPYDLPFKNQKTYLACFVTTVLQFVFSYSMAVVTVAYLGLFYTITLHFFTRLKIVVDAIDIMGDEMAESLKTKKQTKKKNLSVSDWIKIIVQMINDVNGNIQRFADMLKEYFLLLEVGSYGCVFFFGMTFFVMEQYYYHTVLTLIFDVILFSYCYVNEKINDYFNEVSDAFYNTCWYNLELKERMDILLAMQCTTIQKGFTASDVHNLTLNRFGLIIHSAYSNCLVLKNLINK